MYEVCIVCIVNVCFWYFDIGRSHTVGRVNVYFLFISSMYIGHSHRFVQWYFDIGHSPFHLQFDIGYFDIHRFVRYLDIGHSRTIWSECLLFIWILGFAVQSYMRMFNVQYRNEDILCINPLYVNVMTGIHTDHISQSLQFTLDEG